MTRAIAFLGPSLSLEAARAIGPFDVRAPARQGDVFRALAERPSAIALVDGVFEASPSVWHHELLAALEAGVAVFVGGSMGALRGAELHSFGVVGVGEIFEAYRDGLLVDDSEVALLHAAAEHGFRPITVPLVNVRHAAEVALRRRVLSRSEAVELVRAAEKIFYQERRWPDVIARRRWSEKAKARWEKFAAPGLPDLKALDAERVLRAAAKFMRSGAHVKPAQAKRHSSRTRRLRIREDFSLWGDQPVQGARVLNALRSRADVREMTDAGLRRKLLAGWAAELGISASADELAQIEDTLFRELQVPADDRDAFLTASGLDAAQTEELIRELALERKVLDRAMWMLSDGPSEDEALASEARTSGIWADTVSELAEGKKPRHR